MQNLIQVMKSMKNYGEEKIINSVVFIDSNNTKITMENVKVTYYENNTYNVGVPKNGYNPSGQSVMESIYFMTLKNEIEKRLTSPNVTDVYVGIYLIDP